MANKLIYTTLKYPFGSLEQQMKELEKKVFGKIFIRKWNSLTEREDVLACLCFDDQKLIGFKVGFRASESSFYSWIGGVDPEYRNKGIARELMRLQHQEVISMGLKKVETKTYNKFKSMLILNLKCGFDIVSTTPKNGDVKILLEKKVP